MRIDLLPADPESDSTSRVSYSLPQSEAPTTTLPTLQAAMKKLRMGKKSSAKEADEAGWGGGAGGDFGDLPDDNSDEEEAEEAVPGLEIVDEEGQTVIETPIRYMALRKLKLRIRSELDSEEVGQLTRGDVILATHSQVQNGRTRLRCQRGHPIPGKGRESGWVSTHEASGSVALIAENCENTVYKTAVETATVRQGPGR